MNTIINVKIYSLMLIMVLLSQGCEKQKDSYLPKDIDRNEYDTVLIGTQTWFKENLKTTKYKNGDPIYLVTENDRWSSWQPGAYCWYDNNPDNKDTYGALYNFKAASSDLLCPDGWHVPTKDEWNELIRYLGGEHYAGGKLKETGTLHWIGESEGTTNESGFTALPGGFRYMDGTFQEIRKWGTWWMSDLDYFVNIYFSNSFFNVGSLNGNTGISVRCIKDN